MKGDTVELLGRLARLTTAVGQAEKEGRQEAITTANQAKKLDFLRAKEKEYRASLEKKEDTLVRSGGADTTLRCQRSIFAVLIDESSVAEPEPPDNFSTVRAGTVILP